MNLDTTEKFPWTTSMMVFLIDKKGRVLLEQSPVGSKFWQAYRFDTTCRTAVPEEILKVSIQEMVCDQLKKLKIYTKPIHLNHSGICDIKTPNLNPEIELESFAPPLKERLLKSIFIYTAHGFHISKLASMKNLYWHQPNQIPYSKLGFLERQFLPSILKRDKITEKISSKAEADNYIGQ